MVHNPLDRAKETASVVKHKIVEGLSEANLNGLTEADSFLLIKRITIFQSLFVITAIATTDLKMALFDGHF